MAVLAFVVGVVFLSAATAHPPVFENAPYVRTVSETTNTATTLVTSFNCTDADGPQSTVVTLKPGGVTPTSPCGSCFSVLPSKTTGGPTDYYLLFTPGQTLSYSAAPLYTVTVQCSDGNETVTQSVDIRLTKNLPPTFIPNQLVATLTVSNTDGKNAGDKIYDVNANDPENDTIVYSMISQPVSSNFEIGAGDGIIRAKNKLISECNNYITFKVNISDGHNNPVGPLSVQVTLDGANDQPDITSLDRTIQVREDAAVASTISSIVTTDTIGNALTYTLTANPSANLAYFNIVGSQIVVKAGLDYEDVNARRTNLTVVASDGYCSSSPRYLYVTVTDANDPPDLQPENVAYSVYEGSDLGSQLTIGWTVYDQDAYDTRTFYIIGGNTNNMFRIDPITGQLSVNGDYNVDGSAMPPNQTVTVQVKDKGGLTDNTTVVLLFKDRNDNRPVVTAGNFAFSVCEDNRKEGATLGQLACTDADSAFQGNNQTYFTGGSSAITVLATGEIIMSTRPAVGQTYTSEAYCHDRGTFPGPLSSLAPMTISVTGTTCTTNAPATTAAPATAAPTTSTITAAPTTAAPSTANVRNWMDENLPWVMVAALLATALLGLLAYMLWVYCSRYCHCRDPCCPRQPSRPQKLRPLTPPKKITPVERQPSPLPPPTPPPAIVGDPNGYIYDFWKERYPDDDYGKHPNRKSNPRPVTPVNGTTPQGSNPGHTGSGGASATKKSKTCTIL